MIRSLPRAAGCYVTTTQFLRELREAMRQRANIREYHWWAWARGGDCGSTSPRSLDELAQLRNIQPHYSPTFVDQIHRRPGALFFWRRVDVTARHRMVVRTEPLRIPNRHDTGSTSPRSVSEIALIWDTISHYSPVLIAPLAINFIAPARPEKKSASSGSPTRIRP
jgi:hypothetical protein